MQAEYFCLSFRFILHLSLPCSVSQGLTFLDAVYRLPCLLDSSCVQPLRGTGRGAEAGRRMNWEIYSQGSLPVGGLGPFMKAEDPVWWPWNYSLWVGFQ